MAAPRMQERDAKGSRARVQARSGMLAEKAKKNVARKQADAETARCPSEDRKATGKDVCHMLGKIEPAGIANILRCEPTFAELEEAVMWSRGEAYLLGRRTLTGNAAAIYEIITEGPSY